MTRFAQTERAALCATALELGPDRPTLCDGWTVKDLVVHLLVREGSPAALGIQVAAFAGLTESASERLGRRDFTDLVDRLASGPARLSPLAIPKMDALANSLEFFIHHEDLRRAQPDWTVRSLGPDADRVLWSSVPLIGRRLVRRAPVGVRIQDSGSGATAVLKRGTPEVTIKGLPGEVALHVFGRSTQADTELVGDHRAVARFTAASLGN